MNLKWCTWTAKVPCASKNVDDFTMSQKCLRFSAWVVWWSIFSCPLCKAADLYKAPHRKTTVNPRSRNILLSPKASKSPLSWLLSWSSQLLFSWMASNWIPFFFCNKKIRWILCVGKWWMWAAQFPCHPSRLRRRPWIVWSAASRASHAPNLTSPMAVAFMVGRERKGVKWGLGWCFRSRRLGAIHVNEIGHSMV